MPRPGPKSETPAESQAAAVVAAATACGTRWLDVGGGVQGPDYALLDISTGEDIGVLEVTALSWAEHNSFFSRKASKHRSWRDPNLRWNWLVSVDGPTRQLRTLRAPLSAALPNLEAQEVRMASAHPASFVFPVTAVPTQLVSLGIVELNAFGPEHADGAAVVVNVMPQGGPYGIESATQALEAVLGLSDNRKKLAGDFGRRELFVWVDPPYPAAAALSTFSLEPWRSSVASARPPRLPPEPTAVWGALWSDGQVLLANALWRGDADGWAVLDPPVGRRSP